jgi:hypothetical protein
VIVNVAEAEVSVMSMEDVFGEVVGQLTRKIVLL